MSISLVSLSHLISLSLSLSLSHLISLSSFNSYSGKFFKWFRKSLVAAFGASFIHGLLLPLEVGRVTLVTDLSKNGKETYVGSVDVLSKVGVIVCCLFGLLL